MKRKPLDIQVVDYSNPDQGEALLRLLNSYACDPMGGGKPLPPATQAKLLDALNRNNAAVSFLGYIDGEAVALANCFFGFSTFACQPLLNIHDFTIAPQQRGKGYSQPLIQAVEQFARQRGCCKVTLEVLQGNQAARHSYKKAGFSGYELDPQAGQALFWEKVLN